MQQKEEEDKEEEEERDKDRFSAVSHKHSLIMAQGWYYCCGMQIKMERRRDRDWCSSDSHFVNSSRVSFTVPRRGFDSGEKCMHSNSGSSSSSSKHHSLTPCLLPSYCAESVTEIPTFDLLDIKSFFILL